eukprot:maker-scaffold906_size82779-snap-gene-0.13 protein:Tk11975 transcript:maker-scaffold906_size82779-snap-gene-0.13-mRNA-1 annotation:"1 transposase"
MAGHGDQRIIINESDVILDPDLGVTLSFQDATITKNDLKIPAKAILSSIAECSVTSTEDAELAFDVSKALIQRLIQYKSPLCEEEKRPASFIGILNMDDEAKRGAVIRLLKMNRSIRSIMMDLAVNRKFIWRCKKRLEEGIGASRRPYKDRSRPIRTRSLIKAVSNKIRRNPVRSMNLMAKDYNVSRRTMQRVVKEDLGLRPYKMQKRQLLSEATREKRLARSKILKRWLATHPDVIVIYSDEKLFDIERKFNSHNDRVISRRPYKDRSRPIRTRSLIKAVSNKIRRNPVRSMNLMAKDYNVSRRTMQRVVKEDLGLRPYKMQKRQLLSEATREKRLARSKILKRWLATHPDVIVIYSDEKLFDIERKFNSHNDRVISKDLSRVDPNVKFVFKRQKPESVMIWAAVASNGKKSPIFRIPDGVTNCSSPTKDKNAVGRGTGGEVEHAGPLGPDTGGFTLPGKKGDSRRRGSWGWPTECPDPQVLPKATSESELEQKETEEIASLGPLYSLTEEKQTRFFQIKEHQYERRRDHLNKYCHTIRHMYDPGMKSPMMSMKDQCILYDKKDGISHCSIAKVASTTWCRHFINLAGVNPKNVIEQFFVKHLWPLPTDVPVEEAIAETLSFVIIRNPLSRLASVYFEKFVDARISLKLIQSIIDLGNRERPKKPNFDQTYEFPEDDPYFPSPIEFLYFVAEDFKKVVKEDIDYHWRPQHGSCPFCRFNFTMYAKMENLQEDTAYLLQKANLTAKIKPDRHENLSRSGGIGSSKDHRFWSRVPGSIIKKMYDLYLLDRFLICVPVFQRTPIHLVHSATRSTFLPQSPIPLVSENSHDPLAIVSPECPDPQVLPKATSESELDQKETEEIASLGSLYSLTKGKQTRFFQIKEHQYKRRRDHLNKYCHTIRDMYDPGMKSPMMNMKNQCIYTIN